MIYEAIKPFSVTLYFDAIRLSLPGFSIAFKILKLAFNKVSQCGCLPSSIPSAS